jgi:hypothetical protein
VRYLRNFVRFCFGIQALGLIGSVLSLCLVVVLPMRFETVHLERDVFGSVFAASLIMAIFDATSAMAWWTLRKGKPSGRAWAIAASIMNLPIPVLSHLRFSNVAANMLHIPEDVIGIVIGVAGLIAFWPQGAKAAVAKSIPARAPKPVRIAGDGTSRLKDYLSQGVSVAIVWVCFGQWSAWAIRHELVYPGLVSFLVQMQIAVLLTTFGHELGHLAAGWAGGKILRSFQVGPFRWAIHNGAWKFDFNLRKFSGGAVAMVAPDLNNVRSRKAFSLIGGPVASLVMGSIFIVVTLLAPGHPWQRYWMFLSMLATFSISALVVNLIPIKPGSLYSDGAQLYQIITEGPWARVHFAFAMVSTSLVGSVRPRDFDVDLINKAADSVPLGERGLLLRLFACMHYLDVNRISEAIASMEAAEELYEQSIFDKPQDICAEFMFVNAFYKRDLAAAEAWSERIAGLRRIDRDADYWRAQTALHWLRGEREEALGAWERGNALAQKLPSAGTYDFTRSCFEKLRVALDAPVHNTTPALVYLRPLFSESLVTVEA